MMKSIRLGRKRGYLDRGENGEIPYDPIYLTSRTIGQPTMHLLLREVERVLLEHQQALKQSKTK